MKLEIKMSDLVKRKQLEVIDMFPNLKDLSKQLIVIHFQEEEKPKEEGEK